MIHAAFNLLSEFVEYMEKEQVVDWDSDPGHADAWKEMKELYDWWKNDRPYREERVQEHRPEPHIGFDDFMDDEVDTPEKTKYREYLDFYNKEEARWHEEDEKNFIRLVQIRSYMWYP